MNGYKEFQVLFEKKTDIHYIGMEDCHNRCLIKNGHRPCPARKKKLHKKTKKNYHTIWNLEL